MKLAISNIAWTKSEDEAVYKIMLQNGIYGLEIAPSRIWDNPTSVSAKEARRFKKKIDDIGLSLVAMQALLYRHEDLTIFSDKSTREKTANYLKKMIELGALLDVKVLVFGSPKNRKVGDFNHQDVGKIAAEFFGNLGDYASELGVYFSIEPNPKEYNTDFICTTKDALELVKKVDNLGFRLHLDTGSMTINKEDYSKTISESIAFSPHFHVSEPFLEPVSGEKHKIIAKALRESNYSSWVSVEMKSSEGKPNIQTVTTVLDFVQNIYG